MTSHIAKIPNPFWKYKKPIAYFVLAIILFVSAFGFVGPALISAAHSELVLVGFLVVPFMLAVGITFIIKTINAVTDILHPDNSSI